MRFSPESVRRIVENMRKHSQIICGFGLGGVFMVSYLPQGIFAHKFRTYIQLHEDGVPVELDQNTDKLRQEVLDTAYLKPEAEVDVLVVPSASPDPVHKGSCKLKGGSLIGLPANFKYLTEDDVEADKPRLLVGGKQLDWAQESSQKFAESLLLSDNAKRFVIARELGYCNTWQAFNRPLLVSVAFVLSYTLGFASNNLYNLRRRLPLGLRVGMYTLYGGVGAVFYLLMKDSYYCRLDRRSDRYAAQLGERYARGGVEYYEKLLQRNKALRNLLPDGANHYTMYGNKVSTWRQPGVPLVQRLDDVKQELAKFVAVPNDDANQDECVYCK